MSESDPRDWKLSDQIYEKIFERIVTGEFPGNSRLPSEADLVRMFGASRPVVREALARLRDDGMVVSRQGSGSYVKRRPDDAVLRFAPLGSIADIQRCFEFRVVVEGAAAALAAQRRDDQDLEALRAGLAALEECLVTGELGVDADENFHQAICKASKNHFFVSVRSSMQQQIEFGMNLARNLSLARPAHRLRLVQDEHVAIFRAIDSQNPEAARAAMVNHIESARHRVFQGQERDLE
jgi:GntR family transcriptional repressor for pyruvate dehydrogenase complex